MKSKINFNYGKAEKKKGYDDDRASSRAQHTHHEYLLELAAANKYYLKFRDEQLPEIIDVCDLLHGYVVFIIILYSLRALDGICGKGVLLLFFET